MGWKLIEEQLPALYAAIDEVECTVASALTNAIGRYGPGHPPETVGLDPNTGSWSMDWWRHLSNAESTHWVLVFQVEVAGGPSRPIASAWVGLVRVADRVTERELWRASGVPVSCPLDAAAGIRSAAVKLCERLGALELRPYLTGEPAEPGAAPDPARM
jgi:hypothetical protein